MLAAGCRGWLALTACLGLAALAASGFPAAALDWQPGLAASEPWRAWTAAAVHFSALHLGANLAGAVLVGALGVAARVSPAMVWAWAVAWPLTHEALLLRPDLLHYGGLSGVLHAGAAVVAIELLLTGAKGRRFVGAAVLAGLLAKVIGEAPWGPALRHPLGWDIATAPFAHATGAACGVACALIAAACRRRDVSDVDRP